MAFLRLVYPVRACQSSRADTEMPLVSSRKYYQLRVLSHESDARRRYCACLTDDANQMFVFLLRQDVEPFFLEGFAKIWVDQRMRTKSDNSLPHALLLFHMRGGVRFLGVSLG